MSNDSNVKFMRGLPEVSDVNMAFSTMKADRSYLSMAENTKDISRWEYYAMQIFHGGGSLTFQDNLEKDEITKGVRYLKALLSSWEPKHEHKMLIAGLVLSMLTVHPKDLAEAESA